MVNIEGIETMPGIDVGDRDFLRAAASVPGSILVTADGPFIAAITERGFDQEYGFSVLPPVEALALIRLAE